MLLFLYHFTTKSEPILSQTPDFEKSRAKRGQTPTAPHPTKGGAGKSRKNFQILFIGWRNCFFQIRRKFLRDCLSDIRRRRSRLHEPRRRAKFPSPFKPLPFCPPARTERAGRVVELHANPLLQEAATLLL